MIKIKMFIKSLLARLITVFPKDVLINPRFFDLFQAHGFHVTPVHFYYPIPDVRELPKDFWEHPTQLKGLDLHEGQQRELLRSFVQDYKPEYDQFPEQPTSCPHEFFLEQNWFKSVDAAILYCMIRRFKPRKFLEIGSGLSTMLEAQAIRKNEQETGNLCELIAIEPYPKSILRQGFPGLSRLIESPVQRVPFSEFVQLQENDILFIDSSHAIKTGGDVVYEYLEILPRLKPGVLIHIHDIFLPAEYPRPTLVDHKIFWNEQYLLQAFLAFNDSFQVLWGSSFMHLEHPEDLKSSFRSYSPLKEWPASFWMRRIR